MVAASARFLKAAVSSLAFLAGGTTAQVYNTGGVVPLNSSTMGIIIESKDTPPGRPPASGTTGVLFGDTTISGTVAIDARSKLVAYKDGIVNTTDEAAVLVGGTNNEDTLDDGGSATFCGGVFSSVDEEALKSLEAKNIEVANGFFKSEDNYAAKFIDLGEKQTQVTITGGTFQAPTPNTAVIYAALESLGAAIDIFGGVFNGVGFGDEPPRSLRFAQFQVSNIYGGKYQGNWVINDDTPTVNVHGTNLVKVEVSKCFDTTCGPGEFDLSQLTGKLCDGSELNVTLEVHPERVFLFNIGDCPEVPTFPECASCTEAGVVAELGCCLATLYDPTEKACCGTDTYEVDTQECCGSQVFQSVSQSCCDGNVVNATSCTTFLCPTEAPTETPTEAPTETPTETPVETPTETPTKTPTTPRPTPKPHTTPKPHATTAKGVKSPKGSGGQSSTKGTTTKGTKHW